MGVTHGGGFARACAIAALAIGGLAAAQTPNPANSAKPAAKAKAPAKPAVPDTAGFSIAKTPDWVVPLAVDPAITVPKAPLQILLSDEQVRVGPGASTHYVHVVRQINDSAGLQDGAQVEVVFDPSYQKLSFHTLDVWRDGRRIDKLDKKIVKLLHRETRLEQQIVDGRMTASIVLDDLRVGDRIEWAASLSGDNPVFGGRFVDTNWIGASNGPIGLFQLRLLAPAERNIRHQTNASGVTVETETQGGVRETRFRSTAVAKNEFNMNVPFAYYYNRNTLEFSEFADWAEVVGWAEKLFAPAMKPSPALNLIIADIAAKAATPEEKLRRALDFVQRDIRYFGTEIGANTHQPADADKVLQQRFGDCKDKSALLTALLTGLGIEASPVLVSMRIGDELDKRLPSPLAFDHAIATVKLGEQTLWLDPTRAHQTGAPAARQPLMLGQGLPVRSGVTALSTLPSVREALGGETLETFSFPKMAEEGSFESVTTFHGAAAEQLRAAMASMSAAEFERFMTAETLRVFPKFTQDGAMNVSDSDSQNAVTLAVRYRTGDSYWRYADERRALRGDFALLMLAQALRLPERVPRAEPMRLGMPGRYKSKLVFKFGEDVFSKPNTSRFDEANEMYELHVRYNSDLRESVIEAELAQRKEIIEAAQLGQYRDKLGKAWPRLSGTIGVTALSAADIEALRSEMDATFSLIQRGKLAIETGEQVRAQITVLALEKQLAGTRLGPKLRAEALMELGISLDHLGRTEEAKTKLQQAVALDAERADIYGAIAVNAFMRKNHDEALGAVDSALRLAPEDTAPRNTRAFTRYFFGDMQKARDEFRDILQSSAEVERSYGAIWLHLASRRLGEDGKQATSGLMPTSPKPAWPYPVLQYLNGQIDFDAAQDGTKEKGKADKGRQCELYFYAAQKALLDKDVSKARDYLKKSVATGVIEFNEYAMAKFELERLDKK